MKICFVISHINNSMQWFWFSEELNKRGIEHSFLFINDYKPLILEDLSKINTKVTFLKHRNFFSHFSNFFKTLFYLKKNKINVVQTELPFGNLIGLSSAFLLGIKKRIYTSSNEFWAQDYKSKKQELIDRLSIIFSTNIITQTTLPNKYLIDKYKIKPEKIVTIWHSLKIEDYLNIDEKRIEILKTKYNINESDFIVGKIARFESWKGHKFLVESFEDLKIYPNIKLFLFGAGDCQDEVKKMINDLDLGTQIYLVDFERDIVALYRLFDIHIHVPIHKYAESFGLTIIEGMISNCAQILTLSGISNETAKDKENCLIVDYSNYIQIAESIKLLYLDENLRTKISNQARKDALKLFNYSEKVDKHIKLYLEN